MSDSVTPPPEGSPVVPPYTAPSATWVGSSYATPPPAPSRRRGLGVLGTVLVAAVVAAIVGAFAGLAGYVVGRNADRSVATSQTDTTLPVAAVPSLPLDSGSIAGIAESTLPAVVSLVLDGPLSGSGSGFVIREDGYILTNNHVVAAGQGASVEAVFADGTRTDAKVIGTSPSYDLAVVKVDRGDLPVLPLGDSDRVRVGDVVVAIGAPLGLEGTVTSGIVSALDRPVRAGDSTSDVSYINAVQTDAAINPGNSGGPLLDARGNVIGVNSAIATLAIGGEAGNIGLGFAIPSNSAARVATEIIATGKSRTPLMGVSLDPAYTGAGARVQDITPGSGAESSGIRVGDVVLAVDGRDIVDSTELVVAIRSYAPGDTITVDLDRNGTRQSVDIVLGDDSKVG
jgi:putative serine protease PepD